MQLTYRQARLTFVQGRLRDFLHLSHLFPLLASLIFPTGNYNTVFYSFQEVLTFYCSELLTEIRAYTNLKESMNLKL